MKDEDLKELYDVTIKQLKAVIELTKHYGKFNSQDFISFLDSINELSVSN